MSDSKYFQRGKAQELQQELKDIRALNNSKPKHVKVVLKKIIANMTMGNDMSLLAPELLPLCSLPDPEIKKMIYLFVVSYGKQNPEISAASIPFFLAVSVP